VLALAMHKSWRRTVLASDIDGVALGVARDNLRANGVAHTASHRRAGVALRQATGLADRLLLAARPYPLIVANILAGPLIGLSRAIARAGARPGRIVLSGLLDTQEASVLAAYRRQGLHLEKRIRIGAWPTLILKGGGR